MALRRCLHIICGGDYISNFTVVGMTLCGARRCQHGRGAKGQKQHLWKGQLLTLPTIFTS